MTSEYASSPDAQPALHTRTGSPDVLASRSGTNQLRGSAFLFGRNEALIATDYFSQPEHGGFGKQPFKRLQFGGSVGGRLVKDRAWFFGSVERIIQDFQLPRSSKQINELKILEGLGSDYKGDTTLYKPWPAVGPSHSHIHATTELVTRNNLSAEDIDEIRVYVGDYQQIMCSPLESRRAPATLVDAKFSLPFLVAVAAVRRGVKISDFSGNALRDPQVLAVAQKVVPIADKTFDWKFELPLGRVEIITSDGRRLDLIGANVPGSVEAPMAWDDISRKFGECASVAARPPSGPRQACRC